MSNRPYALLVAALLFSIASTRGAAAQAKPSAVDILKKTQALVDSARTYQATVLIKSDAGKQGSMTLRTMLKAAGNKQSSSTAVIGQPTGSFAIAAMSAGIQTVDDGKTMWIYSPMMKGYHKRPSMGKKAIKSPFSDVARLTRDADVSLGGIENVSGKPSYVIRLTPKQPERKGEKVTIYVEQGNYHMRQMRLESPGRGGDGKAAQPSTVLIQVTNEKFNEPIPDSAFKFTPPPGAKEMVGGMFGGGAPPGAARRPSR
jgi:outer membrane lipoprotein-sorting protein